MKFFSLSVAIVFSIISCILVALAGIALFLQGQLLQALLLAPIAFLYSLAMFYVFRTTLRSDGIVSSISDVERSEANARRWLRRDLKDRLEALKIRSERVELSLTALRQTLIQQGFTSAGELDRYRSLLSSDDLNWLTETPGEERQDSESQ